MNDLLKDQNEFDNVVKHKAYRYEFLEEFGKGWKVGKEYGDNAFRLDDLLKFLLSLINKNDFSSIETNDLNRNAFAVHLGRLVGMFRTSSENKITPFMYIIHSSKTIAEIILSLKRDEYRPFYLALRKIIIDWSDREKKGLNALGINWQKINIIFSAL